MKAKKTAQIKPFFGAAVAKGTTFFIRSVDKEAKVVGIFPREIFETYVDISPLGLKFHDNVSYIYAVIIGKEQDGGYSLVSFDEVTLQKYIREDADNNDRIKEIKNSGTLLGASNKHSPPQSSGPSLSELLQGVKAKDFFRRRDTV